MVSTALSLKQKKLPQIKSLSFALCCHNMLACIWDNQRRDKKESFCLLGKSLHVHSLPRLSYKDTCRSTWCREELPCLAMPDIDLASGEAVSCPYAVMLLLLDIPVPCCRIFLLTQEQRVEISPSSV